MVVWETPVAIVIPIYLGMISVGVYLLNRFTKDRTKKVSNLRIFIQTAAVVALFMGLIIGPFNVPNYLPLGYSPRNALVSANLLGTRV